MAVPEPSGPEEYAGIDIVSTRIHTCIVGMEDAGDCRYVTADLKRRDSIDRIALACSSCRKVLVSDAGSYAGQVGQALVQLGLDVLVVSWPAARKGIGLDSSTRGKNAAQALAAYAGTGQATVTESTKLSVRKGREKYLERYLIFMQQRTEEQKAALERAWDAGQGLISEKQLGKLAVPLIASVASVSASLVAADTGITSSFSTKNTQAVKWDKLVEALDELV